MSHSALPIRIRRPAGLALALATLAAVTLAPAAGRAQTVPSFVPPLLLSPTPIMRIEEDWSFAVTSANPINHAPLVVTMMAAASTLNAQGAPASEFAIFNINFATDSGSPPTFLEGGMGVELWDPTQTWPTVKFATTDRTLLNTLPETVSWTQRLELSSTTLTFSIRNGASQTWGTFGQQNNGPNDGSPSDILVSTPSLLTNLNAYSPDLSAYLSSPTWMPYYVTSMTLNQVRYYDASGKLVQTDTTQRQAYP